MNKSSQIGGGSQGYPLCVVRNGAKNKFGNKFGGNKNKMGGNKNKTMGMKGKKKNQARVIRIPRQVTITNSTTQLPNFNNITGIACIVIVKANSTTPVTTTTPATTTTPTTTRPPTTPPPGSRIQALINRNGASPQFIILQPYRVPQRQQQVPQRQQQVPQRKQQVLVRSGSEYYFDEDDDQEEDDSY